MNAGNVVMGTAGLLASLVADRLSVRLGLNRLNRPLLLRIRIALKTLLSGKLLASFVSEYCELLLALGKLAVVQCLVFLIFTVPVACIYLVAARCNEFFASVTSTPSSAWIAPHELIFMGAFLAGSVVVYVRRRK